MLKVISFQINIYLYQKMLIYIESLRILHII
nr:MAG TPA: hypothetical protein [Crassvirales sp.]